MKYYWSRFASGRCFLPKLPYAALAAALVGPSSPSVRAQSTIGKPREVLARAERWSARKGNSAAGLSDFRLRIETSDGVFVLYDAALADGSGDEAIEDEAVVGAVGSDSARRREPAAMLAYWFDLRTGEFSVFPRLLRHPAEVGVAVTALSRDLAVDAGPMLGEIKIRGGTAEASAEVERRAHTDGDVVWILADAGTVLRLMGATEEMIANVAGGDPTGTVPEDGTVAVDDPPYEQCCPVWDACCACALGGPGPDLGAEVKWRRLPSPSDRSLRGLYAFAVATAECCDCNGGGGGGGSCTHRDQCRDSNPCTTDGCRNEQCYHGNITGLDCPDDGDPCTADYCMDGECGHPAIDCDDDDPCTADSCVNGACVNELTDPCCGNADPCDPDCGDPCACNPCSCLDCDDNDPCTTKDCVNGSCTHEPDPCCGAACNVDDPCCGDSDPCCNPDNPCCENNDPCDPACAACNRNGIPDACDVIAPSAFHQNRDREGAEAKATPRRSDEATKSLVQRSVRANARQPSPEPRIFDQSRDRERAGTIATK